MLMLSCVYSMLMLMAVHSVAAAMAKRTTRRGRADVIGLLAFSVGSRL